jgi:hypothetical protein
VYGSLSRFYLCLTYPLYEQGRARSRNLESNGSLVRPKPSTDMAELWSWVLYIFSDVERSTDHSHGVTNPCALAMHHDNHKLVYWNMSFDIVTTLFIHAEYRRPRVSLMCRATGVRHHHPAVIDDHIATARCYKSRIGILLLPCDHDISRHFRYFDRSFYPVIIFSDLREQRAAKISSNTLVTKHISNAKHQESDKSGVILSTGHVKNHLYAQYSTSGIALYHKACHLTAH